MTVVKYTFLNPDANTHSTSYRTHVAFLKSELSHRNFVDLTAHKFQIYCDGTPLFAAKATEHHPPSGSSWFKSRKAIIVSEEENEIIRIVKLEERHRDNRSSLFAII